MDWWLGLLILFGVLTLGYWPFLARSGDGEVQAEIQHVRSHHRRIDTGALLILSVVFFALALNTFLEPDPSLVEGVILLMISVALGGIFTLRLRRWRWVRRKER